MRITVTITVSLLLLGLYGCSDTSPIGFANAVPSQALLFDAWPGWPTAGDMAVRSPWPSTVAYNRGNESVTYLEVTIDRQGLGFHDLHHDRLYRRVETRRQHTGHR